MSGVVTMAHSDHPCAPLGVLPTKGPGSRMPVIVILDISTMTFDRTVQADVQ
jgi:hypothetical protein